MPQGPCCHPLLSGSFAAFAVREGGVQTVLLCGVEVALWHVCRPSVPLSSPLSFLDLSTPRGLATDIEVSVPAAL